MWGKRTVVQRKTVDLSVTPTPRQRVAQRLLHDLTLNLEGLVSYPGLCGVKTEVSLILRTLL